MEAEVVLQAISTVGFPVVCVLIMFYYVKYLNDLHAQEIKELRQDMISSNEKLQKSIEANTLITTKLYERMNVADG